MSQEISERTPLLAEPTNAGAPETTPAASNDNTSADEHYARFRKRLVFLTSASVCLSVVSCVLSIAVALLVNQFAPPGWYLDWTTRGMNETIILTVSDPSIQDMFLSCLILNVQTIFTAFVGFLNLVRLYRANRPLWLFFNVICDLIFMFYLFICSTSILMFTISPQFPCQKYKNHDQSSCLPFAIAIRVLLIVSSASGLILG